TSLYAGAAVAVAAKLFGQEAVLFADSGSVKTVFQRRYFKPRAVPTAAQALLVVTLAYSLNFYVQQAIAKSGLSEGLRYLNAVALTIIVLFGIGPWFAARYMRVNASSTFRLSAPDPRGLVAAACFGCSTWILALRWNEIQQRVLPMDSKVAQMLEHQTAWMWEVNPLTLVFFMAVVPALCEELFFRGYALTGLRASLGRAGAVVVVAIAFGMAHYSAQRLVVSTALGLLLGLLVVQYHSIWPAMILHFMHNAITITVAHPHGIRSLLVDWGFPAEPAAELPDTWLIAAGTVLFIGVLICVVSPRRDRPASVSYPQAHAGG
ncbi:MAG: type II CAAX prenyl endopeptidase Rce1 family protein, partial [Phycisphaerae bacterium]